MRSSGGEWRTYQVRELAAPKRWALNGGPFGSKLTTKHYVSEGVPVIRGVNLPYTARFSADDFVWVSEQKADELLPNNAHAGDLVFTQRGTIGQVGLIPHDTPFSRFVISQSQMKLTVDRSKADPLFLYYLFRSPDTVQQIRNLAMSSGVPHINLEILRSFEVQLPDVSVQQSTAGILGAYDDLIEEHRQRISFLEEMARAVYIDQFAGRRVAEGSVPAGAIAPPEGWRKGRLDELLLLQRGFDLPFRRRRNGQVPIYAATGVVGWHDSAVAPAPGLVTGRSGTLGRVHLVQEPFWPLNTTLWSKEFRHGTPLYCYYVLKSLDLDQFNSGAAVPTLNRNDIHGLEVLIPPSNVLLGFEALVMPLFCLITLLQRQIQNLRQTRDLLLPRLMSGQFEFKAD